MTLERIPRPVAFILKGYPRLSETFIAQEIRALEQRGLDIRIISLRHPTDHALHPVHKRIRAAVNYLPEYLYQEPMRVWGAWAKVRRLPGFDQARRLWLDDLRRDPTPNRARRFGQAMVLAAELVDDDTAQLVQLQLEYAPAPPFNAGSPDVAPSAVVDEARLRAAPSLTLRTEITERAAAKLGLR